MVAPPDVELSAAALNVTQYSPRTDGPVTVDGLRTVFDQPRINLNTSIRAEFDPDVSDESDEDVVLARADTGSVDMWLRTPSAGVLVAAAVASVITSVLLWLVAARLAELDGQTSSAVLLVAPAIVAAYLARPGEHAFATRLLVGVRICALGTGLCSLAVAAIIGLATIEIDGGAARATVTPDATIRCVVPAQTAPTGKRARAGIGSSARRAVVVRCLADEVAEQVHENPLAKRWVRLLAGLSSLLSAILLIGFIRTWVFADIRHRNKRDVLKSFATAEGQGS